MTTDKHLAIELVAALADRFGAGSKVAREVPGWIEYLTDVECPERPRTRPVSAWWGRVRSLLKELRARHGAGEDNVVRINAARIGQHFGLSGPEASILEFFASYHSFDMFEHIVDRALKTQELTPLFLIAQFAGAEQTTIREALRPDARLRASGLLQTDGRHWSRLAIPYKVSDRLTDEHDLMLDAIRQKDVETADRLAHDHTRQLRDNFLSYMTENYSRDVPIRPMARDRRG